MMPFTFNSDWYLPDISYVCLCISLYTSAIYKISFLLERILSAGSAFCFCDCSLAIILFRKISK